MRRLRVALIVALGLVGAVGLGVLGAGLYVVHTDRGNAWVRERVERALQGAVGDRGRVALGTLRLAPFGTLALDSITVRDAEGALVLGSGPVRARFEILPLTDRVVQLREVEVDRPRAHLVADSAGAWNVAALFASGSGAPGGTSDGGWRIVLDTLAVRDAEVSTRRTSAAGAPDDSAQYRLRALDLGASRFHTGSGVGAVRVQRLVASLDTPPVEVTHAAGEVLLWRDSLRLALPVLRLPATIARLDGRVRWDAAAPRQRLALAARTDSLGFSDIAWISPLVPRGGRGRAIVRVTDGLPGGALRYAIDSIDARATDSRVRGRFVAEVGETVAIRDLDLMTEPLDFALIRELFGDSVPAPPWDGVLRGRLRATGGPLDRWRLDASTLEFEDRRIGGARSRLTIAGVLDLLAPSTVLAPLDVTVDSLDVRTAGAVTAVADSLTGYLTGRVRLEGPLEDYRFTGLELTHHDGALPRTVVRGRGRIAADTARAWLESSLEFEQIGLAALGPAVTPEPLRGVLAGRLDASARGDTIALRLALHDGESRVTFDGTTSLDTARLLARGELTLSRFDANRYLAARDLPVHMLTARAALGIDGRWDEPAGPLDLILDSTSTVAGLAIHDARALLTLEPGGVRVDTLIVEAPLGRFTAQGRLSRDPALRDTLRFAAMVDSLALIRGLLPDSLAAAWGDSLHGSALLNGLAFGSLDTLDIRTEWEGERVRAGSYAADSLRGDLLLFDFPSATRGLATFDAVGVELGGVPIHRISAEATVREPTWADASVRLMAGDSLYATARLDARWTADSVHLRLDSLDARAPTMQWRLTQPARITSSATRLHFDSLRLASADGARFDLLAQIDSSGPITGTLHAVRVPIAHAAFTGLAPAGVQGLVSFDAELGGTWAEPTLQATGRLDSARVEGRAAPGVRLRASYARRLLDLDVQGLAADPAATRDAFRLTAALPLDLTFESRTLAQRKLGDEVFIRFVADGSSLSGFEALLPEVSELQGGFDADVLVSGRWGALEPRGSFLLRDGSFAVSTLRTGFRDVLADVALTPDSVIVHRFRLSDERAPGDSATLEGTVFRRGDRWNADFRTFARNLRVIDDPRLAEADASWLLRLRGPVDSLVLGGEITVPSANAYIGRQRAVLDVEPTDGSAATVNRYMPRIEELTIRLGNEVRLRSPEANVQLTGSIGVTGTLRDPSVRGEILATRGSYRLDLGPLQRTFQVDSGVVRMNGPLDIPPALDIHTSYLVRQADREDVKIGARLTGTAREPRLVLSSSDLGSTASETEIISYLIFGSPSFALDNNGTWAVRTATAALVPSLGGAVERALGGRIPFISELQVTTVAGDSPTDFTLNSFEGLLNSLALTAGSQIGTDSYLNVSAGVCRGESRAASALARWFGIAVEYRPRERLSALLSLNPGSTPCNRVGTFSQIYQFGLDLYRDWRW